jgi:pimeloyl-ACP methyl ester carboxylesterase/DNA-binding winged helix-turn-helix (wHTH) protein
MGTSPAHYQFGPFHLDAAEHRLPRDGVEVPLQLKVFETLCVLVENAGRLLKKEDLLSQVWPDTVVEENNLNKNVSILRKALGERATGQSYIETVPRVGYRFVAPVKNIARAAVLPTVPAGASTHLLPRQDIRLSLTQDGVRLAWASIGDGPPLVKASNWLTHLDFEWGSPIWQHWWTELSKHHRVIRYDERGNGMSQRDVPNVSFDTWVRDLETVVDAAGLERFSLLGISRGGAIAIAYTVKHPERVSKLVLYGAFPMGLYHFGSPEELEARRALISLTRLGWGLHHPAFCRMFTNRFMPNSSPVHERWFDDLQRVSTSAENASRLIDVDSAIDVRGLLRQVRVPTLVIHCDGDQVVAPERGRQLAAEIPGARYASLPSANHLLLAEEPAWQMLLQELSTFLEWQQVVSEDAGEVEPARTFRHR